MMMSQRLLLLATLSMTVGCLEDVPEGLDEDQITEEDELAQEEALAEDGEPESSDDELIIESDILVGVPDVLNLWDLPYSEGTRRVRRAYDSDFGNDGFNDRATSLFNRTPYYWLLYRDSNYA